MRIAVLMSTYNGQLFLDKQLESLANQTVADEMTVYIRDDGSTDNTFDIIENWKKKIKIVLYKEKNAGPAMSFWMLLMNPEIQADYYAFCDQDDIWDANKIEKGIEHLKGNTYLYACNCRIIDENDTVIKEYRTNRTPNMTIRKLFVSGCTQGCSMIFSNTLCQRIRTANISCIPMHDLIIMLYANCEGSIYWDTEPRFGYRVHSNNVVAKNNKTGIQKLKTVLWNWKNSSKHSMSIVAEELIASEKQIQRDDMDYLMYMSNYKKSIIGKWKIMEIGELKGMDKNAVRSYRIRVLLNLL